jgi:murein DD-endopeptidase MepM/ murein hydrolase activator NlpD
MFGLRVGLFIFASLLVVASGSEADARSRLSAEVRPAVVTAGEPATLTVRGNRARRCTVTARPEGGAVSARLSTRRRVTLRITTAGVHRIGLRCGGRATGTRLRVNAAPAAPVVQHQHPEFGRLPVDQGEVDGYRVEGNVGGPYSTRVPFAKGMRVHVSQGAGGGFSHGGFYTRHAVDLTPAAGTPVLAGFSGVVAAARGGCAASDSWGCGSGFGNFVLLKHADGTCAIHAHLAAIHVAAGQQIARYTQVGTVGSSGSSTGPHLHYDRMNCSSHQSLPWSFEDAGSPGQGQTIVSGNEPVAQTQPQPAPQPTPQPQPQPQPKGFTIEDAYLGGTWARTDPNDGTWYSKSNRPANGAYWYGNGLGVGVDCARAAASYTVSFYDGRKETWNTWFHVTDGKWFPSAAAKETSANGFYGLPVC